jgi:hypothetical protein
MLVEEDSLTDRMLQAVRKCLLACATSGEKNGSIFQKPLNDENCLVVNAKNKEEKER